MSNYKWYADDTTACIVRGCAASSTIEATEIIQNPDPYGGMNVKFILKCTNSTDEYHIHFAQSTQNIKEAGSKVTVIKIKGSTPQSDITLLKLIDKQPPSRLKDIIKTELPSYPNVRAVFEKFSNAWDAHKEAAK
jgi:hypothetical protein